MISISWRLLAVVPAVAISCTGPPSLRCDDWISKEFFRAASLSDVERCLGDGVDVNESLTADVVDIEMAEFNEALGERIGESAEDREALGLGPPLLGEKGDTPLHVAAESSETPAVIEALLSAGADLSARDGDGRTPLHVAARRDHSFQVDNVVIEIVEALLLAGADVNARDAQGRTPLHMAAESSDIAELAEVLLSAGAEIGARDENGLTPLHAVASWSGASSVADVLLIAGADVSAQAEISIVNSRAWVHGGGATPLHFAVADMGGNDAVMESLLSAGANIEAQMAGGVRPIHLAALNHQPDALRALLEAGAEPEAQAVLPTHDQYQNDDAEIKTVARASALHWAATNLYNASTVEILVSSGLDVNARAQNGLTPLHLAASVSKHTRTVDVLLEAGADPQLRDGSGLFPADYAEMNADIKDTPTFWKLNDARFR